MERGRDCLYFGFATGEEQGAKALFDGAYKIESEEYLEETEGGQALGGRNPQE